MSVNLSCCSEKKSSLGVWIDDEKLRVDLFLLNLDCVIMMVNVISCYGRLGNLWGYVIKVWNFIKICDMWKC